MICNRAVHCTQPRLALRRCAALALHSRPCNRYATFTAHARASGKVNCRRFTFANFAPTSRPHRSRPTPGSSVTLSSPQREARRRAARGRWTGIMQAVVAPAPISGGVPALVDLEIHPFINAQVRGSQGMWSSRCRRMAVSMVRDIHPPHANCAFEACMVCNR